MSGPAVPRPGPRPGPLAGLIAQGALPRVLRDVYVARRTGRLHISRGDQRYSVRFVKGDIVHCESSVPQSHLGEVMVALGMLEEPKRAEAAAIVDRTGKRLGEVLLGMGAIDQGRLLDALAAQVREHLLRVFSWPDGGCAFEERREPRDPVTLKLSTGEMILEAVRLARGAEAIRCGLGDLDSVVVHSSDPLLRFQRITLTGEDGFVLSRVDGTSTARQVLLLVPLPPEDAERSLFGLLCTGLVDFVPAEEARPTPSTERRRAEILELFESLSGRDHFQVLEVAPDASAADVAAAFHRRGRRFHPDTGHDPGLGDLREQLEAIFERLAVAHEILRRPASRLEYERSLGGPKSATAPEGVPPPPSPPPRAASPEDEARKADEVMAMAAERAGDNRQWEAIGLLEGLVTVASGTARRRARMQLAELYAKNPRAAKSAEEQLLAVIAENPGNVDARIRLARLFEERQMPTRALEHLREVLALQPTHRGALEMMAAAKGPGKGLLGRLRGR